jgi:protein BCP1
LKIILDPNPSPAIDINSALVFSLRLLNLPLPLIPPLYRMMLNESKAAQGGGEVPEFTHWLVWGRGYRLEGGEEGMGLDVAPSTK